MTDNWLEDADRSRQARARAPRAAAATTLLQVRGQSPEVAASAARAADVLGIIPEAVVADPSLENDARAARDLLELETAPATARFLAAPSNAAVAHDQVERLAIMERLLAGAPAATASWRPRADVERELRQRISESARARGQSAAQTAVGRFIERQGPAGRATANILRGMGERGAQLLGGFGRASDATFQPVERFARRQMDRVGIPSFDAVRDPATGSISIVRSTPETYARGIRLRNLEDASVGYVEGTSWEDVKRQPAAALVPFAIEQGLVSVPDMAAALASLPAYVAARTGEIGQTRAENDLREDATAADLLAALPASAASALLERIGTRGILGIGEEVAQGGVRAIPRAVGGAALKEGITEGLQEGIESVGGTVGTATGFNAAQTGEQMLAGALAGMVFGGGVRTVTAPIQQHIEGQRLAVEARANILDFDAAAEAIRDNPLMDRAPERLRAFIEGVAGDEDVAIPAERMRSFFQSNPDLEPWLDEWGIRDQYEEAVTSGADITVSKGEYLARIAPTEAHTYFRDDLRLGEGAMTLREAEALEAEGTDRLRTVVSEVTTAVEEQAVVDAPGQAVFDDVFTQLQAAGFTPAVSRQYARVWQARAETRAKALPEVYADAQAAYRADPLTITQALPDALRNSRDRLDVLIEALRKGGARASDRALFGRSLLEFVSREGGMTDPGGELMAMGADGWHRGRPGQRRLIRPPAEGSTDARYQADYVIQRAVEAGYLPEGAGPDALFAAIREELSGRNVYANDGSVDLRSEQNRAALDDLEEVLGQLGLDPRTATNAEIKAALDTLAADPSGEARGGYDQAPAGALMAVHNITASKLMNAVKLGGLPVPSLAILRPDMDFSGFGDITLIAPPSLVDPKVDSAAKVFASDVYSPRYPRATYQMDNGKRDALSRRLRPAATLVDEDVDLDKVEDEGVEGWAQSIRQETILRAAFLMERGDTVVPVMHTGPGFRPGAVDTYATRDALRDKVEPLDAEYAAWLEELTAGLVTGERIFDGWTNAGRKKFLPHDLDTVVRILKRSVRDGENWNYGVGSIRSKVTPQFKTLKAMKAKADKLVSKEAMDAVKEEADRELIALAERMEPKLQWASPGFGYLDLFSEHLKEAAERRGLSALDAYYNDVTAEDRTAIGGFLAKLADLPTEYFEAKIQRAVGLDEFVGAVVPSDTPAAARKALEDAGLEIREYPRSDNAARIAAVQEFRGSYFQRERGRIDFTSTGRTIRLFKEKDLSTFLHESGHAFLEELMGDAALADTAAPDARVRADRDVVLQWFGVASADDIGVEQHEQWARAAEAYFMEGKAPSLELRPAFARFKAWLVAIYRTVARLKTPINDDIRGVMDRLLATEEQIVEAQAKAVHNRLFADAESAGMTAAEFARYTALDAKARAGAEDRLMKKVMEPLRRKRTQEYEEAWEKARPANEERIDALPEMQAIEYLRGRPSEERLSKKALVDQYGSDAILKLLPYMRPAMYSDDGGLHPDALAEIVGARNGEDLVNLLMQVEAERVEARDMKDRRSVRDIRVDMMTDEDMVEMWGDPFTDGRLEQDALDAVHELQRAEAMASEANVLARQAGVEGLWTVEAMQDYAAKSVAKLLARKVRPSAYLRAERAAGNEAQAAFAAQRFDDALDAKLRQNVNFWLYRAAVDAEAAITKANELFGRVMSGREADVARYRNMDMVYAARGVLAAFGVSRWDQNAAEYMAKLKEYDPDTWAILAPYVDGAMSNAKPVVDLTYREFGEMAAVVKQLWEMSRRSKVVEIDGRKMELEKVTGELTVTLLDMGPPKFGDIGRRQAVTDKEKALNGLMGLGALVTKVEEWSARKGPEFTKYIWTPVSKAADDYRAARRQYLPKLLDALKAVRKDMSKPFKIDAPELGYTFGANRGAGLAELLGALRHTGNESNLRKLLLGREWASERPDGSLDTTRWDAFLARKHADGTITKAHWDYLQAEWDLHEEIKPMAQRAHRTMYGRYFSEVTAQPVVTPFGVYRGGYVAAAPDPDIDSRAQERQAEGLLEGARSGTFTFPGPANGFTKSRVEYNTALDLDIRKAVSQMDQVLRFAFIGPAARDVNRILADRPFARILRQYDPNAWLGVLLPWLERTVTQRTTTPSRSAGGRFFDNIMAQVGRNTGMSIMFASVVNTAQQFTGFGPAMVRAGKGNVVRAFGQYLRDPAGVTKAVRAASKLMAERGDTQMQEVSDAADAIVLNPNLYEKGVQWTERHAYFMQHGAQNLMDPIIWLAAREKGVQERMDDPEGYADMVIRTTQGSRAAEDVSAFSAGPKWAAPFKAFTSYFIDQGNMLDTEWRKAGSLGRRAEIYALGFLLPAVLSKLIVEALGGRLGDEEEDGYLDEAFDILVMSQVQYALAMIPLLGQSANLVINRFDGKMYNDRLSVAPFISTVEAVTRVPYDFWKLSQGTGDASNTAKDVLTAVAVISGLPMPTRQVAYGVDILEGDVEPSGPVDAARGFATGTPSEGTRQ